MKTDLTLISVRVANWLLDAKDYILGVKCTTGEFQSTLSSIAPLGNVKLRAWRIGQFIILKPRRKQ